MRRSGHINAHTVVPNVISFAELQELASGFQESPDDLQREEDALTAA